MNPPAHADPGRVWPRNTPGDGSLPDPPPRTRPQPPLREVLQGLDVRELEGESVFDQLFELPQRAKR